MSTRSKLYLKTGSVTAPAITFRGTNSGISADLGDIRLHIDGAEKLKLSNAGILSLPGYSGNNGKYLKMDASGVLSADTPAGGGATGSEAVYSGFAVKQDGTESTLTSIYASKVNKIITLGFIANQVNLLANTNTIKSRILPNDALWPDMTYNYMTPVFINNKLAYVRFAYTDNNYYLEFFTYPTLAWDAGAAITIQPFTITYTGVNNTALTGTTWGLSYYDITKPYIITLTPSSGISGIEYNDNLIAKFSETVTKNSGTVTIKVYGVGGAIFETFDISDARCTLSTTTLTNDTLTINPTGTFSSNTQYTVLIAEGSLLDIFGNRFSGIISEDTWKFTTTNSLTVQYLDSLTPAATCACSVNKLLSAYAGPCAKIRRGGDNIETDINFSAGVMDMTAFNTHVTGGGGNGLGYIRILYDQSGNGNHFIQTVIADQPVVNFISGRANIVYNGTNTRLTSIRGSTAKSSMSILGSYTMYITYKTTTTGIRYLSSGGNAYGEIEMQNTYLSNLSNGTRVDVIEANGVNFQDGTHRFIETYNNGTTLVLNTDPGTSDALTGSIGISVLNNDGSFWIGMRNTLYPWNGSINTFITFGTQIPTGNLTTIRNSIKNI